MRLVICRNEEEAKKDRGKRFGHFNNQSSDEDIHGPRGFLMLQCGNTLGKQKFSLIHLHKLSC